MNQDSNKIMVEFYRSRDLDYKILNLPLLVDNKDKYKKNYSDYINSINLIAKDLSFDKNKFDKLLKLYLKSAEDKDFDNLKDYIHDYYKKVEQDIKKIPSSIEKGYEVLRALIEVNAYKDEYQVYDAFVLLKDEISNEKLENIFSYWKESGNKIWVSLDDMDDLDSISHYRFRETFNFVGFDSIFEIEDFELQFRLLEGLFDEDITYLTFNLWLIDRIPDFINFNKDLISFVLKFIARQRNIKGFWESNVIKTVHERVIDVDEHHKSPLPIFGEKINIQISFNEENKKVEKRIECEPSNFLTALCSLSLLKHPVSDNMKKMGIEGAKWLSESQNLDGSWSDLNYNGDDVEEYDGHYIKFYKGKKTIKPDLFVTLIAIETIFRSGIPNKERYVKRGFNWIKKQQNEMRVWNDPQLFRRSSFPLFTVLVLELEKLISSNAIIPKSDYLMMSKDFLNSSIRFLSDESLNSGRLAIITAYHGIEFFLYSILTQDNVNISIFKKNGDTIGMKNALNKFQEDYLKHEKIIKQGEIVDYKNSLMELKNLRDNIIHQAYHVDQSKCEDLVEKARKFTSKYSIELWNSDILD